MSMTHAAPSRIDQLLSRYQNMMAQQNFRPPVPTLERRISSQAMFPPQSLERGISSNSLFDRRSSSNSVFERRVSANQQMIERRSSASQHPASATSTSSAELAENSTGIRLTVDLPGVRPSEVEVVMEDGVLTVQATRSTMSVDNSVCVKKQKIQRRYVIDTLVVDTTRIHAVLEFGVLSVTAPKKSNSNKVVVPIVDGEQDTPSAQIVVQNNDKTITADVVPSATTSSEEEIPAQQSNEVMGNIENTSDCSDVTEIISSRNLRPRRKRSRS